MNIRIATGLVVVLSLMSPVFADGIQKPPVPLMSRTMMMSVRMIIRPLPELAVDTVSNQIQLTPDQKQKLLAVLDKSEQTMGPLAEQYLKSLEAVRSALFAPDKDGVRLREATDKAARAEAAVVSAEIDFWTQAKTILTDDQLAKLQEALGKLSARTGPPTAQTPSVSPGPSPVAPATVVPE
ncbi:MAG: periplasmic heavy metal sensor [Dehalococcoidia bacterium]|nr:periplasmic heavy metal sensor [Dehalococcoidia bacterium]